jgi:hypothetical protein
MTRTQFLAGAGNCATRVNSEGQKAAYQSECGDHRLQERHCVWAVEKENSNLHVGLLADIHRPMNPEAFPIRPDPV